MEWKRPFLQLPPKFSKVLIQFVKWHAARRYGWLAWRVPAKNIYSCSLLSISLITHCNGIPWWESNWKLSFPMYNSRNFIFWSRFTFEYLFLSQGETKMWPWRYLGMLYQMLDCCHGLEAQEVLWCHFLMSTTSNVPKFHNTVMGKGRGCSEGNCCFISGWMCCFMLLLTQMIFM